jgi:hypothetical protein
MFYHVLKNLAVNAKNYIISAGIIDDLSELNQESINILLGIGAISPVALPPFEILPDPWPARCKRLDKGSVTPENFVNWTNEEIAQRVHTRAFLVARWRQEYYLWFMPEQQVKRFRF